MEKPTREEIAAAAGRHIDDVIARDLRVLFCGINPGLYSAATGHHFARPGNRFWPVIHRAGFTDRKLAPQEQAKLLTFGLGLTNVVPRATAAASELTREELVEGVRRLEEKARRFAPRCVAVLGLGAYRVGFARPNAVVGEQTDTVGGARVWVLPNPSGLNAGYGTERLVALFEELRAAIGTE